jgi:hypothetical protein
VSVLLGGVGEGLGWSVVDRNGLWGARSRSTRVVGIALLRWCVHMVKAAMREVTLRL